jgi:hypothetical protein
VPDLDFAVQQVNVIPYAATPTLNFSLKISDKNASTENLSPSPGTPGEGGGEGGTSQHSQTREDQSPHPNPLPEYRARRSENAIECSGTCNIHSIALRCQIRIEPTKRRYQPDEQERLHDLFGEPSRWGQTLKAMLWTNTSLVVPPFTGSTIAELPVPCTFDFNIAATKFFYALGDGEVPLNLLFSGTIFYEGVDGHLLIEQIPWDKEANFRLPVRTWKDMMALYYPNTAWLCLRQDAFDRLQQFKSRCGLPTWEAAVERLLDGAAEEVPS